MCDRQEAPPGAAPTHNTRVHTQKKSEILPSNGNEKAHGHFVFESKRSIKKGSAVFSFDSFSNRVNRNSARVAVAALFVAREE